MISHSPRARTKLDDRDTRSRMRNEDVAQTVSVPRYESFDITREINNPPPRSVDINDLSNHARNSMRRRIRFDSRGWVTHEPLGFASDPTHVWFADADLVLLTVEGDLPSVEIIEVVFEALTLCERAAEALVGVIRRAARRGSAV